MATKRSDLLSRLPTVNELLEKPPLRALADRWNRSSVAAGVRSFLDELRSDLQRRAADAGMLSPRELAERAARYVVALERHAQRPTINATGRVFGPPWAAAPLADAALERMYIVGRHYVAAPQRQESEFAAGVSNEVAALVCRITGAQAAAMVHSYAGAVWLALASTAAGREALVARRDMGEVEDGCSLSELACSAGARLCEVGTTNRAIAANFETRISPQSAIILRVASDMYSIAGQSEFADIDSLIALARDREIPLLDALGAAPLVDLPEAILRGNRSARSSIVAGADLVIVRGDGFVGGPPCGLILGRRELVEQIVRHPMYPCWRLDALKTSALAATLERYESKSADQPQLPLFERLTASIDNLQNRAERLAPQLAEAEDVASAEATATRSPLLPGQLSEYGLESYGVTLVPASGDVAALERRLATSVRAVLGRIENDRLMLDLRLVFPREDEHLVEIVTGSRPTAPAA